MRNPSASAFGIVARAASEARQVVADRSKTTASLSLPEQPAQARRFGQMRAARSAALLEDYTELIADLASTSGQARATDIARRLGVSHPTALKGIARLKREGLATGEPYQGVILTQAGRDLAERARIRHRLVVDVLVAIGVPREAAEADGEGIEHHVSDVTLGAFRRFLAEIARSEPNRA